MPRAPTPSYTVAGSTVAALLGYVKARGLDLTKELTPFGLSMEALLRPDFRVAVETAEALWLLAAQRMNEPDFGLRFAALLDLDGFHLVGHLAASSTTVGQAISRVVEFSRLLHDAGRTEVEHLDGEVHLFPGCRGLPKAPPTPIAEFNTASTVVLIRFITGRPQWKPTAVHFFHPAPADVRPHRALFGVAPTFNQPETELVFGEKDLALPVRVSAPSRIGQYLESYARTLLAQLPEKQDDLRDQVLRALISSLPTGGLTIEAAAQRLAMTPRTLQRRLAETNDTFSQLVDEARLRTAQHYLADHTLTLGEISYLLGFHEPSTFQKAFRRWKGVTPGAWREQAQRTTG
jgi:AraC-like DNA-binding protein